MGVLKVLVDECCVQVLAVSKELLMLVWRLTNASIMSSPAFGPPTLQGVVKRSFEVKKAVFDSRVC